MSIFVFKYIQHTRENNSFARRVISVASQLTLLLGEKEMCFIQMRFYLCPHLIVSLIFKNFCLPQHNGYHVLVFSLIIFYNSY